MGRFKRSILIPAWVYSLEGITSLAAAVAPAAAASGTTYNFTTNV